MMRSTGLESRSNRILPILFRENSENRVGKSEGGTMVGGCEHLVLGEMLLVIWGNTLVNFCNLTIVKQTLRVCMRVCVNVCVRACALVYVCVCARAHVRALASRVGVREVHQYFEDFSFCP